jgi:hypothetical protein
MTYEATTKLSPELCQLSFGASTRVWAGHKTMDEPTFAAGLVLPPKLSRLFEKRAVTDSITSDIFSYTAAL